MSNTSESSLSTIVKNIEGDYYLPIKIVIRSNERHRYVPVSFERKLIKYDIIIRQDIYPNGSLGRIWFVIKIDNSKNVIRNRFEILDIRKNNE